MLKIITVALLTVSAISVAGAEENFKSIELGNGYSYQFSLSHMKRSPRTFVRAPMRVHGYGKNEQKTYLSMDTDARTICDKLGFRSLVRGSSIKIARDLVPDAKKGAPILAGFFCSKKKNDEFTADERVASSGAVFLKVAEPGMGESWSSPDGRIWGDVIGRASSHTRAESLCRARGARLPTEDDFVALTTYLRDDSKNFIPQILPHLGRTETYWSSAVNEKTNAHSAQSLECDANLFCTLSQQVADASASLPVRCVKGVQTDADLKAATARDARPVLQFEATISANVEE